VYLYTQAESQLFVQVSQLFVRIGDLLSVAGARMRPSIQHSLSFKHSRVQGTINLILNGLTNDPTGVVSRYFFSAITSFRVDRP